MARKPFGNYMQVRACSGEVGTGSPIRTCAKVMSLEHGPFPKKPAML
jgi:hypothetical protein